MPNREIQDHVRRAKSLSLLTDAAYRLWWQIVATMDDFGRYEADPEILLNACFMRTPKGWTVKKVEIALLELTTIQPGDTHPLLKLYEAGGKRYLQVTKCGPIRRRADKSKFPDPERWITTFASIGGQRPADAGIRSDSSILRSFGDKTDSSILTVTRVSVTSAGEAEVTHRFQEFWQDYPARNGKKLEKAATEALFRKLSVQDQSLAAHAVRNYAEALKAQGISAKDPKRFLRDRQGHEPWRDWIEPAHLPSGKAFDFEAAIRAAKEQEACTPASS